MNPTYDNLKAKLREIKAELQKGNYIRIGKIIRDALGEPEPGAGK